MAEPMRLREITEDMGLEARMEAQAPQRPRVAPAQQPQEARHAQEQAAAIQLLRVALVALGQRFIIALAALRGLVLASAVFALCWAISHNPTFNQIALAAMFAVFVIVLEVAGRRKGD